MKREEKAKLSKREQFAELRSGLLTFLYHKEGDEPAVVMGRTALSWGKFSFLFVQIFRIIVQVRNSQSELVSLMLKICVGVLT
jgi:hypothetical protein